MSDLTPEQIDCGKQCPCRFGYIECDFPNCYSKDELVNVIEKKNGFIIQLQEQVKDITTKYNNLWNELKTTHQKSLKDHRAEKLQQRIKELEAALKSLADDDWWDMETPGTAADFARAALHENSDD